MPMVYLGYCLILVGAIFLVFSSSWYYYMPSASATPADTYRIYGIALLAAFIVGLGSTIVVSILAWYRTLPEAEDVSAAKVSPDH